MLSGVMLLPRGKGCGGYYSVAVGGFEDLESSYTMIGS